MPSPGASGRNISEGTYRTGNSASRRLISAFHGRSRGAKHSGKAAPPRRVKRKNSMAYKLLIVDDSKLARMAAAKAMSTLYPDWVRFEASNSDEAVALAKR